MRMIQTPPFFPIHLFGIFGFLGLLISLIYNPVSISLWQVVLLISLVFTLISSSKKDIIKINNPYFLLFIPFIVLIFSSVKLQISYHGAFHTAYVLEVYKGNSPPTNVVLPGFNANVYWIYHAFLATLYSLTKLPIPMLSAILNFFSAFYCLIISKEIIKIFSKNKFHNIKSLILVFSGNLFGFFHLLFSNQSEKSVILTGDPRLTNILEKFLNFNSFPLGILFNLYGFYLALTIIKQRKIGRNHISNLLLIFSCLIFYHPTTAIFSILNISLLLIISFIQNPISFKRDILKNQKKTFLSFFVFLSSIIYFLPLSNNLPVKSKIIFSFPTLKSLFSFNYAHIILMFLSVLFKNKKNKIFLALFLTTIISSLLVCFIQLPDLNQYKFVFLINFNLAIFLVNLLNNKKLILLVFLFIIFNFSISFKKYFDLSHNTTFFYKNEQINLDPKSPYSKQFIWLRENTDKNSLIINPLLDKNNSEIFLVSERLSFVTSGYIYAEGIKDYSERLQLNNEFFANPNETTLDEIIKKSHYYSYNQIYLILPDKNSKKLKFPVVYSGKDAKIYKLTI